MCTIGALSRTPASEPWLPTPPNGATSPDASASQYPDPLGPAAIPTTGAVRDTGGETTVKVNAWTASPPTPLWAVKVIGNTPDCVGVPERTLEAKDTPVGRVPDSAMTGAGFPEAVGTKVPATPTVKVAAAGDVNEAACR